MSTAQVRRGPFATLPGAVVYPPGMGVENLLADFTRELKGRGWRVGGVIQETVRDAGGRKCDMALIELDTGRRVSIAQALGSGSKSCMLDPAGLVDGSGALRRAVAEGADLVVVNKFGDAERQGRGLADDMLAAMAEGMPLLTAVPGDALGAWLEFTGGHCRLLRPDARDLWRWWGAERLYDDLVRGVADDPVRRVVVGLNWTMVEGPHGVGLAQTPARETSGCRALAGIEADVTLRRLARRLLTSWDPFDAALGIAAVNAHYNRRDLEGEAVNGLDLATEAEGRVVCIGAFPRLARRRPDAQVIERSGGENRHPAEAAHWLLPGCAAALVTASTLPNRTLPPLLDLAEGAEVVLLGPGCPLSPRLFSYGVTALSGMVVEDTEGLAAAVAAGAAAGGLRGFGRFVTLRRP